MVTRKKITITLRWSARIPWKQENADRIPQKAGVYVLVEKNGDQFLRQYVGQGVDLHERFVTHLQAGEPNKCLRDKIAAGGYFRWAAVSSKDDRLDAERTIYFKYTCSCNQVVPPGSGRDVEVELDEQY